MNINGIQPIEGSSLRPQNINSGKTHVILEMESPCFGYLLRWKTPKQQVLGQPSVTWQWQKRVRVFVLVYVTVDLPEGENSLVLSIPLVLLPLMFCLLIASSTFNQMTKSYSIFKYHLFYEGFRDFSPGRVKPSQVTWYLSVSSHPDSDLALPHGQRPCQSYVWRPCHNHI